MPETRQIGRATSIEKLETRLDSAAHQWLIGERRIGKTSVAKAVLARLRARGSVALDIDLSKRKLSTPEELAGEIARQAQAARAGEAAAGANKFFNLAKRQRGRAADLSKALKGLGYQDEGQALAVAAALLAGADDGAPGLENVLEALSLHARASERRACVLLDEVHLLANLGSAETQVAAQCRQPDNPVVFVLAGSEESAAQALRAEGQPLAAIGEEFELAEIAREDWIPGLRARSTEVGIEIADTELDAIVTASAGHPRRTMLIASRVTASVRMQPDDKATATVVELAIGEAKRDRSWR